MDKIKTINIDKISADPRVFIDGSERSVAKLSSLVIGRGVYKPGWKWSAHAGPQTGKKSGRHIGWIQSGKMIIQAEDGSRTKLALEISLKLARIMMLGLLVMNPVLL